MELLDTLMEGIGNFCTNLGKPMFGVNEISKFSLTPAQKVTATKVGIAFLGIAGIVTGASLVGKAWAASESYRKEIEIPSFPSLQPEIKRLKETIMNPIHLLGRIKMVFNKSIIPLVTGIVSLSGSAFVFSRFDKLLKLVK
ncbi:MAG TPA: hypothetical protein VLE96_05865 [Chlamydiales bacterium]|nr:hypothetical protein [Chlamydiales bacterium]